jgi:hypothetical protein
MNRRYYLNSSSFIYPSLVALVLPSAKQYNAIMDVVIKYAKSAFKHGYTDADVRWAFKTKKYDAVFEEEGALEDLCRT